MKVVNEKEKQEELASRYTEVEDKLEAQARKLMVACSENTQDLKKLHSKEEMANIQTRNTEVATPWKAVPSSVRWSEDSPSLGAEGCTTSCSSLCLFPRQLRRSLLQCTLYTMVMSSIGFNTKGPTIALMENASIAHRLKQLKWDLSLKTGAAQPWRGIS